MTDYQKIIDVMCWETFDGETPEQTFVRESRNNTPPPDIVVDIVAAGGLDEWANKQRVKSQAELYERIMRAIRKTIADPVFNDRQRVNNLPPFANFFYYCQRLDRNGKTSNEAQGIAGTAWYGTICRRNTSENLKKIFNEKPDRERFNEIADKISEIWGFTPKQIDALRYFVCQTRQANHNPSLNKSIYFWGKMKGTGKSTVGRAIITILNGDVWDNYGVYESTLNKEMGYSDHDLPLAALYNCVFLDETVPKDSRKSYNGVKRMLTSNSFNYNPKYRQVITIPCKRIYIFTSNDDIAEFIQDESERRFVSIEIAKVPIQLTFEEIYDIWKEFAVNCEPEEDWKTWYDSFDLVKGVEALNIEEVKNEMRLRKDELFSTMNGAGSYFTIKSMASMLFKNEPTKEQKKSVSNAVHELFHDCKPESNPSYYSKVLCRERLNEIEMSEENEVNDGDGNHSGLPF